MYKTYGVILILFLMTMPCASLHAAAFNDFIGADHWDAEVMTWTASSNFDSSHNGLQTVLGNTPSLTDNLYHTNNGTGWGMWLSAANGGGGAGNPSPSGTTTPAWIAYDFGESYLISDMWIWNYNQSVGLTRSLKDVVIDVSLDGENWTTVFNGQLTQATGADLMPHNDEIDINMEIQFVVISASTNFGDAYYGLSEVRWNIVSETAVLVGPEDGAVDVPRDTDLEWMAGAYTDPTNGHDVYLSQYLEDIEGATTASPSYQGRQTPTTFDPGLLEYGKTYYWRVDEVNLPDIWEGNIWSFTVINYVPVDDFEYTDNAALQAVWTAAGNAQRTLNSDTVCQGTGAMNLDFNNTNAPYYSAAKRTYASPWLDLESDNIRSLSLSVAGDEANDNILVPLYIELKDSANRTARVDVAQIDPNVPDCAVYDVDLAGFRTAPNPTDFDLAQVAEFSIGVGDGVNPGQTIAGDLYIDDIRKYAPRCQAPPANDLNNDCVVDNRDLLIVIRSWLENNLWP